MGVLTTGCIRFKRNSPVKSGIFKSFDKGDEWRQKGLLVVTGGLSSLEGINIKKLFFDPSDNSAIYAKVQSRGIMYTYNGGENWLQPRQLNSGDINTLAIDPKNKCVIYVSVGKRVLKSVDCSRSYQEIYLDSRDIQIHSIAVNPSKNLHIYLGTSKGDFIRSIDGGTSWNTIFNLRSSVNKILINPQESNALYAILKNGISKSTNGGNEWESLNDGLKKYSGGTDISDIILNPSKSNSLLLLNKYGIMKTDDGGTSWIPYNLITPPLSTKIYAVGINPKNENEIYYGTASTFYKTSDGGENWTVKRLPSAARTSSLLVDPINPSIIYLGTVIDNN